VLVNDWRKAAGALDVVSGPVGDGIGHGAPSSARPDYRVPRSDGNQHPPEWSIGTKRFAFPIPTRGSPSCARSGVGEFALGELRIKDDDGRGAERDEICGAS
jgi:hypothetical protein